MPRYVLTRPKILPPRSDLSFFERIEVGDITQNPVDKSQWVVVGKTDYTSNIHDQTLLTVRHETWQENPILAYWATCTTHDACIAAASEMENDLPPAVLACRDDVRLICTPSSARLKITGKIKELFSYDMRQAIRGRLPLTENIQLYNSPYRHAVTAHVLCAPQGGLALNIGMAYVEDGARCPTLVMRPAQTVINSFLHCRR